MPSGRRKSTPPRLTDAEMVERYLAGSSLFEVGLAADRSAATVKVRLLRAGVTIRPRGGKPGPCNSYLIGRKRKAPDGGRSQPRECPAGQPCLPPSDDEE